MLANPGAEEEAKNEVDRIRQSGSERDEERKNAHGESPAKPDTSLAEFLARECFAGTDLGAEIRAGHNNKAEEGKEEREGNRTAK